MIKYFFFFLPSFPKLFPPSPTTYLDGSIKDTWQFRGIVDARKTASLPACLARLPPEFIGETTGGRVACRASERMGQNEVQWKRLTLIRAWPGGLETNSQGKKGPFPLWICLLPFPFAGRGTIISNTSWTKNTRPNLSAGIILLEGQETPAKKEKKLTKSQVFVFFVLFPHPPHTSECTVRLCGGQILATWVRRAACSSAIAV